MGTIAGIINLSKSPIKEQDISSLKEKATWWQPNSFYEASTANGYMLQCNLNLQQKMLIYKNSINHLNCKIVADARLDNRATIEKKLGVDKNVYSNEDLILLLYKKYGEELFNHLIGAFAFVIIDEEKNKVFAARDQMGLKPFFFYLKDNYFVFSTEKTSILSLDFVNKQADWQFIVTRFNRKMSVGDSTEHLFIKVLQPAHFLFITGENITKKRYWDLDITKEIIYKNEEDYICHFQELFEESIACRIKDADHVGSHLSGGLDSGGITGATKAITDKLDKSFSSFSYTYDDEIKSKLKNPNKHFDYRDIIEKQIAFSNIKNAYKISDPIARNMMTNVQHEAAICGGLSWSNNIDTEYEIQALAQQAKVNVMLSGFPGDELVTSFVRPYYLEYLDKGAWFKFFTSKHKGKYKPHYLIALFILKVLHNLGIENSGALAGFYQKKFRSRSLKKRFEFLNTIFSKDYIKENADLRKALNISYKTEIHENIPLSLKAYQRNHILRPWTARRFTGENSAARYFNLEYRYPLADIRLLQFVLALPLSQKRNEQQSRLIFRKGIAKYVHPTQANVEKKLSSLKPLSNKIEYHKDLSLKKLWNEVKDTNIVYFLNKQLINEIADKAPQNLNQLFYFFVVAELVKNGKLSI